MKLIFLGSGSAFTIGSNNFHSNMLFETPDKRRLLIDCGSDARFSLNEINLTYKDITDVYISHLHADHAGGLEWLAFTTKFDPNCIEKPVLHISETLVYDIWNKCLCAGLSSLQGVDSELASFFVVKPIPINGSFQWDNLTFRIVQTVHALNAFAIMPSFGLLTKINNLNVFISTDTQFAPYQLHDFYKIADIIFHDCETMASKSGVHSNYRELVTLDPKVKAKMWLYHYNPGELPDAKADGFRGFVKKGQVFDFNDPNTLK